VEKIFSSSPLSRLEAGTTAFMAPELHPPLDETQHASKPTPKSDVFAFASLMFQVFWFAVSIPQQAIHIDRFTPKKAPFHETAHQVHVMSKILKGVLPSYPSNSVVRDRGLSDEMWALIDRVLEISAMRKA